MAMKLYADADSYMTHKILITARYAQLEVESLKAQASGKVPVLETPQGCIFSSHAIARYISRIRRDAELYGQNLLESGEIDSWMELCTHDLEVPLSVWVYSVKGLMDEVPEATAQAKVDVARTLHVLDKHLLTTTFFVGNQATLADICICCALVDGLQLVLDAEFRKPFPNLVRWLSLCLAQPEFVAVLGKVQMCSVAKGCKAAPPQGGKSEKKQEHKAASPKATAKGSPKSSPAKKEKGNKKKGETGKKEEEPAELTSEQIAENRKKLLKKVIKAGGKRGVEIEGAADMGGLGYFCTSVDEPAGDLEMMDHYMEAMNEKSDPTEEERKGGSGEIGKMIFSAGDDKLAILAYVPESKKKDCDAKEWLTQVLAVFQGEMCPGANNALAKGFVTADGNVNKFPLKMKEPSITEAITFLKKKGLFPDKDDDSDDDYVYGEDDFPS